MPNGSRSFSARALLAILALGLLLRLLHFRAIADTAFPWIPMAFPNSDMHAYWEWAREILAGDVLGRHTYHPYLDWMHFAPLTTWLEWWGGREIFRRPPLYPYLVAGLLWLGRSADAMPWVLLAQLLLGALQPLAIFALARRLFGDRAALLAALLVAIYGPFIFYQGALLRDWLPPVLEPIVVLALLRAHDSGRARDWFLAGLAFGLALLTKETIVVFLPAAALWLAVVHWGRPRAGAAALAFAVAGHLTAIAPLVVRNLIVGAPAFAVSNRMMVEAIIGGNAADGYPAGISHPPSTERIMERSGGRLGGVVRETLATYQGDWARLAAFEAFKLRLLVDRVEHTDNLSFYYTREISPVLRFTPGYAVVLPLGIAGVLIALPTWRRHLLLALYASVAAASLMVPPMVDRHRLVLVPVLAVYAGAGLAWAWQPPRRRRGLLYAGLVSALALAQGLLSGSSINITRPQEYFAAARIYAGQGRFEFALAETDRLEARCRLSPRLEGLGAEAAREGARLRLQWAQQLAALHRVPEARRELERAAAVCAERGCPEPLPAELARQRQALGPE